MKYCMAIGAVTSPTTPLLLGGDFTENMKTAQSLGFDAVEIHTPEPGALDIPAICKACRSLNISIATIGTGQIYGKYGLHLMDTCESNQKRLVDMVKEYIRIAAALGSRVTIGSIKGNVPKGGDREEHLGIMGRLLQEIDGYAEENGVIMLLEATNHFENNVLNTGAEVRDMIERNGLKNFRILMDTYHINLEERSLSTCLKDAGPWLGHIHFADNTRLYPGSGSFQFDLFCRSIQALSYDGVLSAECYPLPDGMTAAEKTIEFFHKQFGER